MRLKRQIPNYPGHVNGVIETSRVRAHTKRKRKRLLVVVEISNIDTKYTRRDVYKSPSIGWH